MQLTDILNQPVPDMRHARQAKTGYREYPLFDGTVRNHERLVDIADYGIAGQSYYSRPNSASVDPLPGISPVVKVREGIAEKLRDINYAIQESAEVAKFFGGSVELYVDEGLRSYETQSYLYDQAFPALLRAQNPSMSEDNIFAKRDEVIAKPMNDLKYPAPHSTGAAVDVCLRFHQNDMGYVPHAEVPMNTKKSHAGMAAQPDYFERSRRKGTSIEQIRQYRRAFYWIMRGALIGDDSGFIVNPTEWWHWSYGDQMWAKLTNAPQAFYGVARDN